ncbi:subtilisin-like protein [Russula dissimulans]|nr:subtilisin-like protein [Russula dissimulans]
MYWSSVFSVLALLAALPLPLASPTVPRWDDMSEKHSWASVPQKWEPYDTPPASSTINLHIALKPRRENALIDALYEVSDPDHPRYGVHLSKEQVAELVAPHPEALQSVHSWLAHNGVPSSSVSIMHGGSWLTVSSVPVAQANTLLDASYQLYRHTETDETIIRTIRYALPAHLHNYVENVAPTTYFSSPHALRKTSRMVFDGPILPNNNLGLRGVPVSPVLSGCAQSLFHFSHSTIVTPTVLRCLYNTDKYVPQATAKNQLGILGFLNETASQSDLTTFMRNYRPDAKQPTFSIVTVNNGTDDQNNPTEEGTLDVQYAVSITFPTPNIYYSTGGSPPFINDYQTINNTNEPYMDFLEFIMNQPRIPQTMSVSYGDDEQTVPEDYATTVCNQFARLGAMGVSVLFASGDFGVGNTTCLTNDGTNSTRFIPDFPSSCPYVTSVGGTIGANPEIAADFSGGGFSNYFPRPDYQNASVSEYLQNFRSIGSNSDLFTFFNASGRAYPDISAQAMNFQITRFGDDELIWGTSAATPTAAAIISLLNDFLIAKGKPPLGFLNPLIYSKGVSGFNDIIDGANPGCGTPGFIALKGWDPITGMGTPDFKKLQALVG